MFGWGVAVFQYLFAMSSHACRADAKRKEEEERLAEEKAAAE